MPSDKSSNQKTDNFKYISNASTLQLDQYFVNFIQSCGRGIFILAFSFKREKDLFGKSENAI